MPLHQRKCEISWARVSLVGTQAICCVQILDPLDALLMKRFGIGSRVEIQVAFQKDKTTMSTYLGSMCETAYRLIFHRFLLH